MTNRIDVKRRIAESGESILQALGLTRLPETLVVLGSGFKGFESGVSKFTTISTLD